MEYAADDIPFYPMEDGGATFIRKCLICWLMGLWRRIVLWGCFSDLPTGGSNEDGHQGTDDIEETVGEIGEGGDTKDGGLRHAASVPGNEYGGDGGRILAGAAKQPQFLTLLLIGFAVHVASENDGNKLVTGGDVEKKARKDGACHQT